MPVDPPVESDQTPPANAKPQFAQVALQPRTTNADFGADNRSPMLTSTARLTNGIHIELGGDLAQVSRIVAQLLEHSAEATSDVALSESAAGL